MKNTLETRLGIFVALAVIAAVLILEVVGGVDRFKPGYHVLAQFKNVEDLKIGDRVKMGGVEIGRVEHIPTPKNGKVLVTMKLHRDAEVKTDSTATVKFTGLLGQNFIEISYGTNGVPATNETMLATSEQPDLSAIMQKIDNVASGVEKITSTFSGDQISNLLGPFADFLKANQGPLTATIANIQHVTSRVAEQVSSTNGTLGKLLYDDTLYNAAVTTVTNLQETASEIKVTLADARRIVDQVNSGQGTLGRLVKEDTLYRETTDFMTNLKEISQKINQGQGSVGKLLNDQEFYRNAKLSLQKIDKATEGLEDQGPLSVLGILVNNLF